MKLLLLLILSFLLISGCTNLRPDYSIPAIKAGYPSAEFRCENEVFHGLGTCSYSRGGVQIAVKGYFNGTIQIDSERCEISEKVTYSENEEVVLNIDPQSSCVIDIVVSPEYPRKSKVDIQSLKGRLYIKKLISDGIKIERFNSKIQDGTDEFISVKSEKELRVAFFGCGVAFDKVIQPKNGRVTVALSELGNLTRKDCLFEGVIGSTRAIWQAWIFDKNFTPLATPKVTRKGDKILIEAEDSVAVLSFGDDYKFGNRKRFKITNNHQVLRSITVAGRSILGIWDGDRVEWIK